MKQSRETASQITRPLAGEGTIMAEQNQLTEDEAAKFREELAGNMWEGKDAPIEPVVMQEEKPLETPVKPVDEQEDGEVKKQPAKEDQPKPNEPDPWEGVPETVRKSIESLQNKAASYDTMADRLKQAERRVGSLQNAIQNPKISAKETQAPKKKPELTEDQQKKVDAFKKEFPEFHEAIDIMTARNAGNNQSPDVTPIKAEIDNLRAGLTQTQAQTSEAFERMQLSNKYPDYVETVQSKEYRKWLIDQPSEINNLINSPKASDAILVLDRYSQYLNSKPASKTAAEISAEREQKLENASTADGRKIRAPKAESDMTDAEIRAKIEKELWP